MTDHVPYAELHAHSAFSFLDGASTPEELVEEAARLNLRAIALTDHDTFDGLGAARRAGERVGVRVVGGLEMSAERAGASVHVLGYGCDPGDAALLEELAASRPGSFCYAAADIMDPAAACAALERLAGELGGMDLCVVSAGTGDLNPGLDYALEEPAIRTNVVGWTAAVDWAYGRFEERGGGHLVVPEHRPPPAELQVRGDHHRLPLVCVGEDLEEGPRAVPRRAAGHDVGPFEVVNQ